MKRGKKIAAALVMLGLGFGAALLFRRTETLEAVAPPAAPTPQKEALVLRESNGDAPRPTTGSRLGPVPLKPAKSDSPPRDLSEPLAQPRTETPPPELPLRFDRSLSQAELSLPLAKESTARLEEIASSPLSMVPQGTPPLRVHRVVDGDTLQRLADRFLGDANRYLEIYTLNQAVVPDPNLLPIGAELKIPPREGTVALRPVSPPAENASAPSPANATELPATSSEVGLVPVPSISGQRRPQ